MGSQDLRYIARRVVVWLAITAFVVLAGVIGVDL